MRRQFIVLNNGESVKFEDAERNAKVRKIIRLVPFPTPRTQLLQDRNKTESVTIVSLGKNREEAAICNQ